MNEIILNVNGMVCGGCENRIKNVIKNIDGVQNVMANHNTGKVTITLNKDVKKEILIEAIEDIGFEIVRED